MEVNEFFARARRFLARGLHGRPLALGVTRLFFCTLACRARIRARRFCGGELRSRWRFVSWFARSKILEVGRALRCKTGKRFETIPDRSEPVLGGQHHLGGARGSRELRFTPLTSLGQPGYRARDLFDLLDGAPLGLRVFLASDADVLEHP